MRNLSSGAEFAVLGDLMVECILRDVEPGFTQIYDPSDLSLGGPAPNIAWHLAHLGRRTMLVGCLGDRDETSLQRFKDAGVDLSEVIQQSGSSDQLVAVVTKGTHRSAYIRAPISDETYELMIAACQGAQCIVLNGSRHPRLRKGFAQLATSTSAFVACNPSYAIYTYKRHELDAIMHASQLTILNQMETKFVCEQLAAGDAAELARRYNQCLVTTMEDRGAIIHRKGRHTRVPSISGIKGDVLGTGDAFLAGLLSRMIAGCSVEEAGAFAAALAAIVATSRDIRPAADEATVLARMNENNRT